MAQEVFFMLGAPTATVSGVQASPKTQLTKAIAVTQLTVVEEVVQFSKTGPLQ